MAKLEEQITAVELLDIIRNGAKKNEIIKKFRTTEQELAITLLPLYRNGDMSKEEFNDFFKGLPLRPAPQKTSTASEPELESKDEPPSQIVKSLTKLAETKSAESEMAKAPEQTTYKSLDVAGKPSPIEKQEKDKDHFPPEPAPIVQQQVTTDSNREHTDKPMDSAGLSTILNSIFAKLNSIEKRLEAIEDKLTNL